MLSHYNPYLEFCKANQGVVNSLESLNNRLDQLESHLQKKRTQRSSVRCSTETTTIGKACSHKDDTPRPTAYRAPATRTSQARTRSGTAEVNSNRGQTHEERADPVSPTAVAVAATAPPTHIRDARETLHSKGVVNTTAASMNRGRPNYSSVRSRSTAATPEQSGSTHGNVASGSQSKRTNQQHNASDLRAENQLLRSQLETEKQMQERTSQRVAELEDKLSELRSNADGKSQVESRLNQALNDIESYENTLAERDSRINQLDQERQRLHSELSQLQYRVNQLEPLQHQYQQVQHELIQTRNQLSEESKRSSSDSQKARELEQEVEKLRKRESELSAQVATQSQNESKIQELEAVQQELLSEITNHATRERQLEKEKNDAESKMKQLEQEKYTEERQWQRAEQEIERYRERADALYYQTGFRLLKDDPEAWVESLYSGIKHDRHSRKSRHSRKGNDTFQDEDYDSDSLLEEEDGSPTSPSQNDGEYHNVVSEIRNVVSNYRKHDREALKQAMKRTEQLCKSLQNRCEDLRNQNEILSNFKSNIRNAEAKVHGILEKTIKNPDQIQQWMDVFDDASLVESLPNISSGLRKLINVLQGAWRRQTIAESEVKDMKEELESREARDEYKSGKYHEQYRKLKKKLKEKEQQIEDFKEQNSSKDDEIAELKRKINDIERNQASYSSRERELRESKERLTRQVDELTHERSQYIESINHYQNRIEEYRNRMKEQAGLLENALSLLSQKDNEIRQYQMGRQPRTGSSQADETFLRQKAKTLDKQTDESQQQEEQRDEQPRPQKRKKKSVMKGAGRSDTPRVSFPPATENRLADIIDRFTGTEKGKEVPRTPKTPSRTQSKKSKSGASTPSARSASSSKVSGGSSRGKLKRRTATTPSKRLAGDTVSSGVRVLSTLGGPAVKPKSTPAKKKRSQSATPKTHPRTPKLTSPPTKRSTRVSKTPKSHREVETSFEVSTPSGSRDSQRDGRYFFPETSHNQSFTSSRSFDQSGYTQEDSGEQRWAAPASSRNGRSQRESQQHTHGRESSREEEREYSPVSVETDNADSWDEESLSDTNEGQLSYFSPQHRSSRERTATPHHSARTPTSGRKSQSRHRSSRGH
eukprot:gb/GECG01016377.1/.p1 GENE.gb/GECG01016377.1/~~gb/GECG01016377.1/.p1  ORF type:complete len:1110 (+),score=185.15 gb/GECG01016377.1/:1-3330(+)